MSFFSLRLWFGRLNVKWSADMLFSERNGYVPVLKLGSLAFVWRRYRTIKGDSP